MGWGARLLVALVLVFVGAGAAVWGLAHYQPAARFLGNAPAAPQGALQASPQSPARIAAPPAPMEAPIRADDTRLASLEGRIARVENATARAEGSAGRADALVVAFAARRAIDRGVALGYLENLLMQRFGPGHQHAVATIVTASHQPVRLEDLIAEYETLGPELRRSPLQARFAASRRRRRRPGARGNDAPSRCIARRELDRQGPALHRGAPRPRRDRIRRAHASTQRTALTSGVGKRLGQCESLHGPAQRAFSCDRLGRWAC